MDNNTTNEVKIAGIDLRRLLSDGLGALRRTLLPFLGLLVLLVGLLCLREYRSYRPMYRASATFTVNVTNPLQSEIRSYNTATAEQMAKTFPYILTSGALNERVMQELNISAMPAVSATVLSNTNIFTLAVSSGDPQLAYDVLNAVITDYPDVAEFVVGPTVMTLLDESGLPKSPYNTRDYTHSVKQGVLIWLVLWLVVALCMASLRTTVHSERELKQILNLRVISALPVVRRRKKKERALCPRMDDSASHSGFSESVRLMRIRAEKEMKEQNIKTLLISSATPGEGKTTIAINLADALAEAGSRVLLIDCDLRSPSVARALNRENEVGLAEYLKGETTYQHIIQRSDNQNLFLIFAGRPVSDASELFAKPECRQFLEACRGTFDYIILDTPPAALLADAAEVAELADGAILAIRQNYAPRHKILECAQILSDSKLPIIGCVMNYVAGGSSGSGYYGYGYGYGGYGYGYGSYGKGKDTTQINL